MMLFGTIFPLIYFKFVNFVPRVKLWNVLSVDVEAVQDSIIENVIHSVLFLTNSSTAFLMLLMYAWRCNLLCMLCHITRKKFARLSSLYLHMIEISCKKMGDR